MPRYPPGQNSQKVSSAVILHSYLSRKQTVQNCQRHRQKRASRLPFAIFQNFACKMSLQKQSLYKKAVKTAVYFAGTGTGSPDKKAVSRLLFSFWHNLDKKTAQVPKCAKKKSRQSRTAFFSKICKKRSVDKKAA